MRPALALRAALALSAFAALCSVVALLVALWRPPAPTIAAQAAASPLPFQEMPASPALLALAGVEILLPHLARPAPFPRIHAVASALVAADPPMAEALAALAEVAEFGAPLPRQLGESFAAAAAAAVLAELGHGPDAGLLMRLAVAGMRLGAGWGAAATPALAATRSAEQLLAQGDLAGADAALAALRGAPATAMAAWRGAAQRRLAADSTAAWLASLATARAVLAATP
jgi:hypothetical protein